MKILEKINDYITEKAEDKIMCPRCGHMFVADDDKLNQVILTNKNNYFYMLGWPTKDPFGNPHVLELYFSYQPASEMIKGIWMFVSKDRTPLAVSNMQNKKQLPGILFKTTPEYRSKLVNSRKSEKGPIVYLIQKIGMIEKGVHMTLKTGTEKVAGKMIWKNLFK